MRPDPKRAFAMAVPHISLLKTAKTRLGIDPGASPSMTGGRACESQWRPRRCCDDTRPTKVSRGLAEAAGGVGGPPSLMDFIEEFGAPGEIRTPDHLVRSRKKPLFRSIGCAFFLFTSRR